MELEVENVGDVAIAMPRIDELDTNNVSEFKSDLVPVLESSTKLVLDLSRLRFIDSSWKAAPRLVPAPAPAER
jgi:anti-anti-sigma regulatory factor